jgi:hypothetical protein
MSAFTFPSEIRANDAKQCFTERPLRNTGSLEVGGGRFFVTLSRDDAIVATLGEKNLRKSLGSSLFDE